jgi:hypothetical protein
MRRIALLCLVLATSLPRSASAAPLPRDLLGAWSQTAGCPADAVTAIFTPGAMEVRQDGEQRSLIEMSAEAGAAREIELRATRITYVRQPNPTPPAVGDVLRFRRDGDVLRLLALTTQGKPVTLPPDAAVFHRCAK